MPRRHLRSRIRSRTAIALSLGLLASAALAGRAAASEGGASFYLLGSGGPGAAELPPVKGVFFDNQIYAYSGSAGGGKAFPLGGKVVADLKANIVADFPTVLTVPSTHVLGGVLAVGGAVPIGGPTVDASAVLTGPGGRQISAATSDSTFVVGDPIATAALGWKTGKFSTQVSTTLNIPVGQYREGALANLSFHRWVDDWSLAGTWHDEMAGWDVSAKAGVTFNGTNPSTDYYTGTEFHIEGSLEKMLGKSWSAGVQSYYFSQLTNDGGPGDTVGAFRGEVTGVGGSVAYHFDIARKPATLRMKVMTEFDAKNRLQGTQGVFDLSFPFVLQLPPG